MLNQRLRNLTTGILHTEMSHIYEDIEYLVGVPGIFTHQILAAYPALMPWLKQQALDSRFFDNKFDTTHEGETEILPMTEDEQREFWKRYGNA